MRPGMQVTPPPRCSRRVANTGREGGVAVRVVMSPGPWAVARPRLAPVCPLLSPFLPSCSASLHNNRLYLDVWGWAPCCSMTRWFAAGVEVSLHHNFQAGEIRNFGVPPHCCLGGNTPTPPTS